MLLRDFSSIACWRKQFIKPKTNSGDFSCKIALAKSSSFRRGRILISLAICPSVIVRSVTWKMWFFSLEYGVNSDHRLSFM
ncbi:hypothetical protein, partial [Candidatus Hakubella thermalkaliphila]|uniref:hypothetical protein n=1 Tax=Candidatus Hakubella thermalkaliphila TaxID=2754717 RepID=UPI001C613F82